MEQLYTLLYVEDYRGIVYFEHEKVEEDWYEIMEEEGTLDNRFELTLQHPTSGFKVYLASEMPNYSVEFDWLFSNKEDAEKHLIKAYSQINNRLPFKTKESSTAYKEDGYYPEVSEEIKNMSSIHLPFDANQDVYYFMILLDTEHIIDVLALTW